MSVSRRWTVADLEAMETKETERYEIIDGELIVTSAPSWRHQYVASRIGSAIDRWSDETGAGVTLPTPGVIFNVENAVIPDVVWTSWDRLRAAEDRAGHLTLPPELAVEVLSPGAANHRRDRQTKLALYSHEGVDEYWIVDVERRTIDVYRRAGAVLDIYETYGADSVIETPLLPGFSLSVGRIWPPAL